MCVCKVVAKLCGSRVPLSVRHLKTKGGFMSQTATADGAVGDCEPNVAARSPRSS